MYEHFNNNLIGETLIPKEACHKCGKCKWVFEDEYTWICGNCGNLIILNYGVLIQQIDIVMNTKTRNKEYIKSVDGKVVKPKKNEELKKIKFNNSRKRT